ncbi:hypothetical protein HSTV1_43 [Haloarcula sinaiiensis tailed virus 1]|uniref:Uncharacterized protein n=1 Tax=Haloarcula sinaiiensis tailed virus 1 TaxID=1262530 RepID=R9QT42_9CAUD|nr:hypothetical protein HSTV1_43 [Haloarcula sinaiiensis tailed virus 1]AGC34588.1 hypothetical protein HSTV1_43 [Haloarcula sinaiiensis tailed virus 1]
MTDEEFRDELRAVVRRHDPDPDELRAVADSLEELAEKWDAADDVL